MTWVKVVSSWGGDGWLIYVYRSLILAIVCVCVMLLEYNLYLSVCLCLYVEFIFNYVGIVGAIFFKLQTKTVDVVKKNRPVCVY